MKNHLFIFLLTLLTATCKKEQNKEPQLPPATQEGRGVFACKMNGRVWVSQGGLRYRNGGVRGDTLYAFGTVKLQDGRAESLQVILLGTYDENKQVYEFSDTMHSYAVYTRSRANDCFVIPRLGYGSGVYKKVTGGHLTITRADRTQDIVAGTFAFNVPTDFCDTLKITEGRFDIKYQ